MASYCTSNIADVIKHLEQKKQDLMGEKLGQFLEILAQKGAEPARAALNAGALQYSGSASFDVKVERISNNAVLLTASGENILFVEFGSGIAYAHDNRYSPYAAGSWSATHAHQIGSIPGHPDLWVYQGTQGGDAKPVAGSPGHYWTKGNPSANAMPAAVDAIMPTILSTFHTVFG